MRINLIDARKKARLTQKEVALFLGMTTRQYQRIESGAVRGTIETWDALEDRLGIPQRQLREQQNQSDGNQT